MNKKEPTSTLIKSGWDILVPNNVDGSTPTVFKIYFGKKYMIWKGKTLLQSCELIAKSVRAAINKHLVGALPDDHYMYHVVRHIKAARVLSSTVEVLTDDFRDDFGNIDPLKVLKTEQAWLDQCADDPNCLNNNEQAYVPVNTIWISEQVKQQFLKWYARRGRKDV